MAGEKGRKKKSAYAKAQAKMTPEQRERRAEKMRLYTKRNRRKEAGLPLNDVPLEGEAIAPGDEELDIEVESKQEELNRACELLQKEMPELELRVGGAIRTSQRNMRMLYQRTWDSLDEEDEEGNEPNEEDGWSPCLIIRKYLRAHFKKRPFDKIKLGLLKIVDRYGKLIWFEPNDEQQVYLKALCDRWYHGQFFAGIAVKSRQIGSSTFWTAVNYCIQSTQSFLTSHVVMELAEKAEGILDMFNMFWENEPFWVRPGKKKKADPLILHGNGVKRAKIKIESAERRDRVARSTTFQLNHLSEIPYWAEPEETFNAMMASMEFAWPLIHIEESTGKNINDLFHTRFFDAMNGKMDGFHAFFFPWFQHKAYSSELPPGVTEASFRASLDDADVEMWDKYNLTAKQVYWYVSTRSRNVNSGKLNNDMFKREYPCTPEEAFLGGSSNFFDAQRNKADITRTGDRMRRRASLEDLKKSISGFCHTTNWCAPYPYARCRLVTDIQHGCADPKFVDDHKEGTWIVLERPRLLHKYVISVDIRRGKLTQKNVQQSSDNDSLSVWRYTHEKDEPPGFVQVAYFHGKMEGGPIELAEHAVAASSIYRDEAGMGDRALIVPENNAHGLAFVEEAKRLGASMYQRIDYGKTGEEIGRSLGFMTTTGGESAQGSKYHLLMRFRREWINDRVFLFNPELAAEMGVFVNNDGKLEAMSPHHDDTVIEAALGIEGVKFAEGEIAPVMVKVGKGFVEMLEEEMREYDQPEKIDVQKFRSDILKSVGVIMDRQRTQAKSKWL